MLELFARPETVWNPPSISEERKKEIFSQYVPDNNRDYLVILETEPYIDAILFYSVDAINEKNRALNCRFVFHEDYAWSYNEEKFFTEKCLKNKALDYVGDSFERIFDYYAKKYPEWNLRRYYTNPMRMLDHIYHCMRKGTAKEMLYKAGLDELAENVDEMDEINLLSSKPSDIYRGLSMRTLRALNCKAGAILISTEVNRDFVKQLQSQFPDVFEESMNEAQCRYLQFLIEGDLTVGEVGRLYLARRSKLLCMWVPAQYNMFIWIEKKNHEVMRTFKELSAIDPIYKEYFASMREKNPNLIGKMTPTLDFYLLNHRQEYDARIKRSNRRRDYTWQERDQDYVIRYPQTINDFCREAVYMRNCLLTYVEAYIHNETTVLFMRKTDAFNEPFIAIEIFRNRLMQAYHRFNEDCTPEEAAWIRKYCKRHEIDPGCFKFNRNIDQLF